MRAQNTQSKFEMYGIRNNDKRTKGGEEGGKSEVVISLECFQSAFCTRFYSLVYTSLKNVFMFRRPIIFNSTVQDIRITFWLPLHSDYTTFRLPLHSSYITFRLPLHLSYIKFRLPLHLSYIILHFGYHSILSIFNSAIIVCINSDMVSAISLDTNWSSFNGHFPITMYCC